MYVLNTYSVQISHTDFCGAASPRVRQICSLKNLRLERVKRRCQYEKWQSDQSDRELDWSPLLELAFNTKKRWVCASGRNKGFRTCRAIWRRYCPGPDVPCISEICLYYRPGARKSIHRSRSNEDASTDLQTSSSLWAIDQAQLGP